MTKRQISRRSMLKGTLAAGAIGGGFFGPWKENRVWAQGAAKPIKLGLTCDASGQYGNSGQDDLRGIRMAIDEINAKGGVLGRKVTWITADTETTPATGSRVAERFITREDCTDPDRRGAFGRRQRHHPGRRQERRDLPQHQFVGAERGGRELLAHQIRVGRQRHQLLQGVGEERGRIRSARTGCCSPTTMSGATPPRRRPRRRSKRAGGKIVDNLLVPQNTRDFTAYLLKIQQAKPDVVATAIGGDDIKALREQVAQLKLDGKPAWINNQQDWPDVWGAPEQPVRRVRHHLVSQAAAARRRRFREEVAGRQQGQRRDPGARQRLLQRLHGDARIAARDRARRLDQQRQDHQGAREPEDLRPPTACSTSTPTWIPVTHQMQQTIYLARRNAKPADNTDLFEIISWTEPKAAADTDAAAKCKLMPYEQVPTVDS